MDEEKIKEEKVRLDDIISLLQIANKAGKLALGSSAGEQSLHRNKAKLCILAEDISERTKTQIIKLVKHQPVLRCGSKTELGEAFARKELGIIIVEDGNFAHGIMRRVK